MLKSRTFVVLSLGICLTALPGCTESLRLFRGSTPTTVSLPANTTTHTTAAKPMLPPTSTTDLPELPPKETAKVCLTLADALERNGHEVEAIFQYEKARQVQPNTPGIAWKLAVLYDRIGLTQKARQEFDVALKETPTNPDLLNDLGYSYYGTGQWEEAAQRLRQAVELQPTHEAAWVNLGMTLAQQNRYEESLAAFLKVLPPAQAYNNLGFLLTTQGKRVAAQQAYRQAVQFDPSLQLARVALTKLESTTAAEATTNPASMDKPDSVKGK